MSMIYDSYHQHLHKPGDPIAPPRTRWIWNIFWVLLAVTGVEIALAFSAYLNWFHLDEHGIKKYTHILKIVYIFLTLLKAYFIIFSYMHLGDEKKNFKLTMGILVVILVYFIVLMMIEGYYQDTVHVDFPAFMQRNPMGDAHH